MVKAQLCALRSGQVRIRVRLRALSLHPKKMGQMTNFRRARGEGAIWPGKRRPAKRERVNPLSRPATAAWRRACRPS